MIFYGKRLSPYVWCESHACPTCVERLHAVVAEALYGWLP